MMGWAPAFWVVLALSIGWYWYQKKKQEDEDAKGIPKGSLGWPIIGETLQFTSSGYSSRPVGFMEKRKTQYGNVFKTNILGTPIIISTDSEVNKVVLQNHGGIFIPAYPKSTMELLGENSIFQTNGYFQKKVHALIGGYLRSPDFKTRITKEIQRSVKANLNSWEGRDVVLVQDEAKTVAFEVLVKALMSVGPGEQLEFLKREFREFMKAIVCIPIKFPGTRLYKSLKAKERLLKLVRKIVEERKQAMDEEEDDGNGVVSGDAIDALMRDKDDENGTPSLPYEFISGNIVEMMIPGEETVPTAMTIAVKFLSDNPHALQRLREENIKLKKTKVDHCVDYTWNDFMSLTFTQSIISETLRLANIINGVWRKAQKDVKIKGYFIPKGWCVMTAFISVHMNEEIYDNPYKFDPWRWESAVSASNNAFFTPFGGGQRLCPGLELSRLEIAIFLHHLVTTFKWAAEEDHIVYFPTVKMRRKLPIKVSHFEGY